MGALFLININVASREPGVARQCFDGSQAWPTRPVSRIDAIPEDLHVAMMVRTLPEKSLSLQALWRRERTHFVGVLGC
jgi:hypothetical protein